MGYTILLQWTCPPSAARPAPLVDFVLNRVLEHYNISKPARSSIQIRTYRASLPTGSDTDTSSAGPNTTRVLSTVMYSQTFTSPEETQVPSAPRDDTAYLFIEDKSRPGASTSNPGGSGIESTNTGGQAEGQESSTGTHPQTEPSKLEDDGFEIVDPARDHKPDNAPDGMQVDEAGENTTQPASSQERPLPPKRNYQTIALRPAASVLPLLQNLLSPFVMGLTKAARASASLIAETPRPTPLPGSNLPLLSFSFPPVPAPSPPLILTIHNLPSSTASTIFLEAEWEGVEDGTMAEPVLKEFLAGCLPEGLAGDKRFWTAGGDSEPGARSWTGIERMRNLTEMLVRALREGNHA